MLLEFSLNKVLRCPLIELLSEEQTVKDHFLFTLTPHTVAERKNHPGALLKGTSSPFWLEEHSLTTCTLKDVFVPSETTPPFFFST